jgi:hypothetical protein
MIRIITRSMRIVTPHSLHGSPAHRPLTLALIGGLTLLLSGCGSHLVKVDSSVLRLRIDEYSITPDKVQMHPGRIKIVVVNTGNLTHNVKVEAVARNENGSVVVLGGTGILHPGDKLTSDKLTLVPGTYKLIDTVGNHADLGDYGTLIIK